MKAKGLLNEEHMVGTVNPIACQACNRFSVEKKSKRVRARIKESPHVAVPVYINWGTYLSDSTLSTS